MLNRKDPEVYSQGSFRLGTVIRPFNDANDYDIDLVYVRDIQKESTTQSDLKKTAGVHLQAYVRDRASEPDAPTLVEGRRNWTLEYSKLGFHMDVLPAIPNVEGLPTSLLITDRELTRWQNSDPKGYSAWFWSCMIEEVGEQRKQIAGQINASVDAVPDWKIKTTLQRAVQILKRHRDMMFGDDDERPTSIIITTLAARAYQRQSNLYDALKLIARDMRKFIEQRNDVYWVANPVNKDENFADKWEGEPAKAAKFFDWLRKLQTDLAELENKVPDGLYKESVRWQFGKSITAQAETALQNQTMIALAGIEQPSALEGVPGLQDTRHRRVPPWMMTKGQYTAQISANVYKKSHATTAIHPLSGFPENKDRWFKFTVSTNFPPPYEVSWQVTNTGRDASDKGPLRGGFDGGEGHFGRERWERALYRGTHTVQAFIVRNNTCYAQSGLLRVVIR